MRVNGEKGAFDKLVSAISKADIVGYEPVEIIAKDFTAPIASKPEMELQLTNILNRPVKGVLSVLSVIWIYLIRRMYRLSPMRQKLSERK